MEIYLFAIILLQFVYIFFIGWVHSKEMEKMRIYNKSNSAGEYKQLTQEPKPQQEEELPDNIIPFEDLQIEDLNS